METVLDKRTRLIEAAARLIHQNGFANTTLADIAEAGKVALGSIYYYFKTKDDVADAILSRRLGDIDRLLEKQGGLHDPRARLEALIQVWVDDRETDAKYGCPIGSLCYELAKSRGPLSQKAARPFKVLLAWCEEQFRLFQDAERAPVLALHLVASLQGVSLISNAFEDTQAILMETNYLKAWLKSI